MKRKRKSFNYNHPVYRKARAEAFSRSDNMCQVCGKFPAEHAHHWAAKYPSEEDTTSDDLTAVCELCHYFATTVRRTFNLAKDKSFAYFMIRRNLSNGGLTKGIDKDYSELGKNDGESDLKIESGNGLVTQTAKESKSVGDSCKMNHSSSNGLPDRAKFG